MWLISTAATAAFTMGKTRLGDQRLGLFDLPRLHLLPSDRIRKAYSKHMRGKADTYIIIRAPYCTLHLLTSLLTVPDRKIAQG